MYGWESWTIKKAERWRIDAFELWRWRRLLRVPWTARRSNKPILKEIGPEYSLETLMLKLKLQYLGHLMWRVDSLEKTLMLGKIEGRRRRGRQRMRWLGGITDSMDMSEQTLGVGDGQGSLVCCSPWGRKEWDMTDWATEWQFLLWDFSAPVARDSVNALHCPRLTLMTSVWSLFCWGPKPCLSILINSNILFLFILSYCSANLFLSVYHSTAIF